jgi:hypothetical protein
MDSKQVIELLAKAMGISCRGKDGCSVVCVLKWEDVLAISTVIRQQDDDLHDATKKTNKLQTMLERAIYELADGLLVDCPQEDEAERLCDDLPMTPETCRKCWRKYFESEVEE